LKKWLVIGGLLGALYGCAGSSEKTNDSECTNNYECASGLVCVRGNCVSNTPSDNVCINNSDCLDDEICDYGVCTANLETPEETWNGFTSALGESDIEKAITYWDPSARDRARRRLSSISLTNLSQLLQEQNPTLSQDLGMVRTYEIEIEGTEYPLIFYNEDNRWLIHGF